MKCEECNKNFKPSRSDAKFCSPKCRGRNFKRKKREQLSFEKEQQLSLGEIQEKQQKKISSLNRQINALTQKIATLKQEYNQLKEQKEISLIELKTIRETLFENDQKIKQLRGILSLDNNQFYDAYCTDATVKADGLGVILNELINISLVGFNIQERNKEIKRVRTEINRKFKAVAESLDENRKLARERLQILKENRGKLERTHKGILLYAEKIKILKKQKLIPVKTVVKKKPQSTNSIQNINSKNGVGGADLLNMKFNTFTLNSELGRFLGELDKNRTAFALTGDSGAGKSYFSFELAKVFIDNGFSAKYFALEEGLGKLTQNKVREYDLGNDITITGNGSLRDVRKDAKQYDLIVIDSFQKLNVKAEEFERLRQDFPKTIFIIIFQKTSSGSMRGGSSIKFNSSATIDVQIRDNERVAVMEKGRYGTIGWVYSIDEERIIEH
jgi:hypothetical protein